MKKVASLQAIVAATAAAFAVVPAIAAGTDAPKPMADKATMASTDATAYSDRERMTLWTNEKQRLASALKPGQTKAAYMKSLADNGYTLTSVNADKTDYVEYEVVKGTNSYEVQIDLNKAGKGDRINVASNIWRADGTKNVLRGNRLSAVPQYLPANAAYSDRSRLNQWTSEKDKLEKALVKGEPVAAYTADLKKMGYQITSTNDRDKNYVEMEIVKGQSTYEVQIDLNDAGKATDIDVTANMWQSDATEKALDASRS